MFAPMILGSILTISIAGSMAPQETSVTHAELDAAAFEEAMAATALAPGPDPDCCINCDEVCDWVAEACLSGDMPECAFRCWWAIVRAGCDCVCGPFAPASIGG